jgi:hypothetical protein
MIFQLLQHEKPAFKAYCWTHIFQLLQRLWHGRAGKPDDYFELDGVNSVRKGDTSMCGADVNTGSSAGLDVTAIQAPCEWVLILYLGVHRRIRESVC